MDLFLCSDDIRGRRTNAYVVVKPPENAVLGPHVLGKGSPNFYEYFQIWLTSEHVAEVIG